MRQSLRRERDQPSWLRRTQRFTFFLNSSGFSRISFAAVERANDRQHTQQTTTTKKRSKEEEEMCAVGPVSMTQLSSATINVATCS
jgi:hypothetical protein